MLKIKNLKVEWKEKLIFSNVNLELKSGEILIVNGSNGSGKTTFLKTIAGLVEIEEGEILCAEHDIFEYFDDYLHDYSYLSTDNIFDEKFSVSFYLNFWAKFAGTEELIDSAVHYFKMQDILDYKISQISSGWRKRLYFAKLILDNKLLWFLDEPFNFLDLNGRDLLVNMINSRLLSGGVVILTSNQKIDDFKTARFFNIETNSESVLSKI